MANRVATIEPVTRESTVSIIARSLRSAIADGLFPQGSQLTEVDLAAQLQVSRGPLREAMQRLVQEGLLRAERNRGLFVPVLGEEDVEDIYLARCAVERAAVAETLRRRDTRHVAALERIIAKMRLAADKSDWRGVADLDLEFHQELVAASGSRRLNRMFATLLVETRMCIGTIGSTYSALADLVEDHERLLVALRSGDLTTALAGVESHMREAVDRAQARARGDASVSAADATG